MESNNLENVLSISTKYKVATLHTEIEYKIHLENNLNMKMYNLIIPITIPYYTKYKDGSLYINEEKYKLNVGNTFIIPIFEVNNILDIKYEVVVEDIPPQGSIDNLITLSYLEDTYRSERKEIKSNKIKTMVKGVKLEIVKTLNNNSLYIDDEIFEDIIIENKGNIKALNLIIKQIVPKNIVIESIIINDSKLIEIYNYKSIPIGNLEPLKSVKIGLYGRVVGVNSSVENIVTEVEYSYFNDYTDKYIPENIIDNNSAIYVKQGYIGPINREENALSLDKKIALIDEEVKLDFLLYNIGNIKVENVKLNLDVDEGVKIIKLLLNDVDVNLEKITSLNEIRINDIPPWGKIKLQGIVKIKNLEVEEKKINIKVEYKHFDEAKNQYRKDMYVSNEFKLKGYGVILESPEGETVEKKCSRNFCEVGDIIEYRISLKNNGNIGGEKLFFREKLNNNSKFIKGSFKVNDNEIIDCDIYKGVDIGSLKCEEILNIQYKIEVLNPLGDWLISTSNLAYVEEVEAGLKVNKNLELIHNKTRIIYPMLSEKIYGNEIEVYRNEDKIIYNIELGNIGNIDLDNIRFSLYKSEELELEKIIINNEEIDLNSIGNGDINIERIEQEEKKYISIILKVKKVSSNENLQVGGNIGYSYKLKEYDLNNYKVLNLDTKKYHIIYGDLKGNIIVKDKNIIKSDEIQAELSIENIGNIDLYSIELISDEFNSIVLLDENIINSDKIPNCMESSEKIIIPIKLKGKEIHSGNIFNYSTNLKAKYKFNDEEIIISKYIDNIEIELVDSLINCEINSDKSNYILGEKAYFRIDISNLGSHRLEEAILQITIPNEVDIVDDCIYIADNVYRYKDIRNGLRLDKIDINESIIIKYFANINKISFNKEIQTYYKVEGYYNIKKSNTRIYKEYSSEILKNRVDKVSAKVFLTSDKDLLLNGQDVKYTSIIINDGNLPIDVNYKLYIGDELEEIKDLTTLNGENIKNIEGPINIVPNDGVIIEKNYVYRRFKGIDSILVQGVVEATYNTGDPRYSGYKEIKTDTLKTSITNTTFKELVIDKIIDISELEPRVEEIINIYLTPTIINQNIRKVKRNYEYNSIDIIGHRLEIIGNIQYTIEYVSSTNNEGVYLITDESVFNSTIVLPEGFIEGETIVVTPKVIDVCHRIVGNDRIFVNINLLINTSE